MQFFDSGALTFAFALILLLTSRRARWTTVLSMGLLACVVAHLLVEGLRWQMFPAYLVAVVILTYILLRTIRPAGEGVRSRLARFTRWFGAGIAMLLLALSGLFSYAFPIFEIPLPAGEHAVGTMSLHLVDENRPESYTDDANDHRELMVRVWYPAQTVADSDRAMYWNQTVARSTAVTSSTLLPWFTFTHLELIETNSYWDAPLAKPTAPYPVILYSHGSGIGWASANTNLVEGLASRGYVVIGIDHAYVGSISIFPDGRHLLFDEATAQAMNQPPPPEMMALQTKLLESNDWREHIALYVQAIELMPETLVKVSQALDTQVADQRFVIGQLGQMRGTQAVPLANYIDVERVGVIGMSLGGSAALETCSIDSGCTAGVNLDGFHPRHVDLALQSTPFLFMNRDDNLLYNTNFQSAQPPVYSTLISGVTHFNFFDFSIMSPLYKKLGVLGPIEGSRVLRLTEDFVAAFFDKHLRDQPDVDLTATAERYPEVQFTQRID